MKEIKFRIWDKEAKKMWYFNLNNSCDFTPNELKNAQQYIGNIYENPKLLRKE